MMQLAAERNRGARTGTFSYLPRFDSMEVDRQVEYLVERNLEPAIEHVEPERATDRYWYLWRLPLFGERRPEAIRAAIEECRTAHPRHLVRLIGYDTRRQTQAVAFVVVSPDEPG
jgi:ribulose-bisphosphate carboxylase small chain